MAQLEKKLGIGTGKLDHLFHAIDWLPTLANIAGVSPKSKDLNGINQTKALKRGTPARSELFLYGSFLVNAKCNKRNPNKMSRQRYAAMRKGTNWKLVHLITQQHAL